jgi:type IV fimbrial biogenesis protein FimT
MNEKGFSLVEIAVVIAVIAILSAVAIPAISSWLPNYTLKSEARDIYGVMNKLKSTAIKENTRGVIIFDPANDTYDSFRHIWI